ncbi:MAG TPA: type II toxin-antitoxin system VapC family toxin [Gaiellaceae bacterium]|nr:type II toxin-antitoxin system VapC family toxin [Gaiellaceae bacterium]
MGRGQAADEGGSGEGERLSMFVDTNVLVRHLTGDPPAQARRATAFLEKADELLLPDLIVAELVYVLESFYEVERTRVAELTRAIIGFPPVLVVNEPLLFRALEVYEVNRLDFAEAYLVASAEASGVETIASFDRTIDRVPTVSRIEPPPISAHD